MEALFHTEEVLKQPSSEVFGEAVLLEEPCSRGAVKVKFSWPLQTPWLAMPDETRRKVLRNVSHMHVSKQSGHVFGATKQGLFLSGICCFAGRMGEFPFITFSATSNLERNVRRILAPSLAWRINLT